MSAQTLSTSDKKHPFELLDTQQKNKDYLNRNPSERYVYHITDLHNLGSIVSHGLMGASAQSELEQETGAKIKHLPSFFKKEPYENKVIKTCEDGKEWRIDDCVHFLFASKDPRLFSIINSKNIDQDRIVFLCMKADKVTTLGGVFSDRYTKAPEYEVGEEPKLFNEPEEAYKKLDWNLIDSTDWDLNDSKLKDILRNWPRMVQALIPQRVDFVEIDAIVVFDQEAKAKVLEELRTHGIDVENSNLNVYTEKEAYEKLPNHPKFYYFKDHILGHEKESLVTGPKELYNEYKDCIRYVLDTRSADRSHLDSNPNSISYRFEDVESLVEAIEKDFNILPELKGIYLLETDTQAHHEDVGAHTLTTIHNLEDSKYYQKADDHLKKIIKLSAYLHDIGKGPREKWPEGIQHRYPDHPRDSISMLKRILTQEIRNLSDKDIHDICLMVIYHDVVGECENKGRNYQEVANIVECESDLEMLYCISEADIRAIKEDWYDRFMSLEEEFREDIRKIKSQSKEVRFP